MAREFFYDITDRGDLLLDGTVQDDPEFVDFFFRRLATSANPEYAEYPFVSRCGAEWNYLRPVDTAIVFTHFFDGRLWYAASLSVPFDANKLTYSSDGVLYHGAPVGERGRLVPAVATEIARHITPLGPYYHYDDGGGRQGLVVPTVLPDGVRILRPRPDNLCIGCGAANPHGLALTFEVNDHTQHVRTWIRPDVRLQGSLSTVHGGFVSLLLDETMGKSLSIHGIKAPTAQLQVNFRRPMLMGRDHVVDAHIVEQHGRKNFVSAEIRAVDDPEHVVAEGKALFITLR
ncbi:MAG: DUF4505 family protein [Bacteroidetes bacterium]|nr:DUF4505 family protein [Bacteroidota bacterium]